MAFGNIKQVKQCFSLFVDNFSVKYFSPDDAQHLINALDAHYGTTIDWTSQKLLRFDTGLALYQGLC